MESSRAVEGGLLAELRYGFVVQTRVVWAIILRETRTRYGAYRLGYMWAILDPAIIILTFFGLFAIANRPAPLGMDIYSFLATGLIPYKLFGSCAGQVGEAINGNRALLYYPRVLPIDLVIARWLFELVSYGAVFMLLMGGHAVYTGELAVDSPLHVIMGLVLVSLLGTAVGLVFCCLGVLATTADRARGPILRPFFWISGVFFTAEMVPESLRSLALTNPILHGAELVRGGFFNAYDTGYADVVYLLQWIVGIGLCGLILERNVRHRIQLT